MLFILKNHMTLYLPVKHIQCVKILLICVWDLESD